MTVRLNLKTLMFKLVLGASNHVNYDKKSKIIIEK